MDIAVCLFAVNFMSVQSTAVHYNRSEMCDWFYLFTSTYNRSSHIHKITLCVGYNSQASQISGSVPYFNAMLIINFSCYCATVTVTITAVLLDNVGGERIVYKISVWQQLFGIPRMWCEDGIKLNHKESVWRCELTLMWDVIGPFFQLVVILLWSYSQRIY